MSDTELKWEVVAEPVGANAQLKPEAAAKAGRKRLTASSDDEDKDNIGGVVVYLARGRRREEVARVGFVRATSENPNVGFEAKLDEIIGLAKQSADKLNELTPEGALQ